MDIAKTKKEPRFSSKLIIVICFITFIAAAVVIHDSMNTVTLDKKELLIASVKKGDLKIIINGYGKLQSEKLQLITSPTIATVKEILLKPGAVVTKDSVIVKLENPELNHNVENSQQELEQLEAGLRQQEINNKRELLTEQAVILQLELQLEAATLKRTAEQSLIESGIVSQLAFKQSQLNERQLAERINILNTKFEQLELVHKESIKIQKRQIKQQLRKVTLAESKVENLTVKAGIDGVLQKLPLSLGQSLSPGKKIALIGSTKELIAEVKIPQSQSSLIELGQKVKVDTRQGYINGVISRIDPIVNQNTVNLDVRLLGALPENLKPQQNIDAEITAKIMKNKYYIDNPVNLSSQSTSILYQMVNNKLAQRKSLRFGEKTNRYVEILSEVIEGETYIISDLTNYQIEQISLN